METIRQTQKRYGTRAMAAAVILGFVLIGIGYKPIGKGIVLGTIFSVVNFVLMGEMMPKNIGKTKARGTVTALRSIGLRYIILAVPLFLGIKYEQFNLFAVIAGLFSVQLAILVDHLPGFRGKFR